MAKLQTVQETKKFKVFTRLNLDLSVDVSAASYEEAEILGSLQLDQDTIQRLFINFLLHNGNIVSPTIHNWETAGYEVLGEDE